jgi:sortase A
MQTINQDKFLSWTRKAGIALIAVSVFFLLFTFFPVIKEEIKYQFSPKNNNALVATKEEAEKNLNEDTIKEKSVTYPVDEEFGIVIPKVFANAKVIADVNWQDSAVYQRALTQGVAHAAGTAHPGENGNIFIFSHSGVDFYEAARYNAEFYLLNKLAPGDEIYLFYKKQKFVYRVAEQKIVVPENVEYLIGDKTKKTLTMMTCWPAGTTLKRLIIIAKQVEN